MDEIKQRLTEASEACITTYEAWRAKSGDSAAREALQEAVHELRKVGARLEIELAVSDRKTHGNEPIPIPSHRAARMRPEGDMPDDEGNRHNGARERDGNRPNRDRSERQGGSRPVQIRQREEGGNQAAGNDAPPATAATAGEGGKKPLSLSRKSAESE